MKPIIIVAHDGHVFFACYLPGNRIRVTNQYGCQTTGDEAHILRVLVTPLFDRQGRLK